MISQDELLKLYETELKENLSGLEGQRKRVMIFMLFAIIFFLLPFGLFLPMPNGSSLSALMPFSILFIVGAIVLFVVGSKKKKKYRAEYKAQVVTKVVHAIDPLWRYTADDRISQSEYYASDMFRSSTDRYRGDDLIEGVIEKTDFRCSELHTEYKTRSTDSDGNSKDDWHTIFKGLFFHADFNKHFNGQTFIEPDYTEKLFGKFAQAKRKRKSEGKAQLVKLEDPEFEKLFKVYSTDQIEARYILTPTVMEAMVNIRKKYNRPMHMSFIGSRVYCAMSFNKDLFEPRVMKSGVNFDDIQMIFNLFMVNATIIHELNLNTRIWTKD